MMFRITAFVTILLAGTLGSLRAVAQDHLRIEDAQSVPEAVEQIRSTLKSQGFEILLIIDHALAAANAGIELRPTTVILASHRRIDISLIRRHQAAAIDIPMKYVAFEDENGKIQLVFDDEGWLVDRHRIPTRDNLLQRLDDRLNQFGRLDDGLIEIESNHSVDDTVNALVEEILARGLNIAKPGPIDFRQRAQELGISLRPTTLVLFGRPEVGTPLMQNEQSIGLDLPMKFLVHENRTGEVFITFNDARFLAKKHCLQRDGDPGLISLDVRLENINNTVSAIAQAASAP